jgi:hypothetical protein
VRCWTSGRQDELFAAVYGKDGSLLHKVKLVTIGSWVEDGSSYVTCRVAVAGNKAVVAWAPIAAPGGSEPAKEQGVVHVVRLLPDGTVSTSRALPVLSKQFTTNESTWLSSLSLTPSGWVGLGWMYEDLASPGRRCTFQANVTWLSPDWGSSKTRPLSGLSDSGDASLCDNMSSPVLAAVGATQVLVVFQGSRLRSELIAPDGNVRSVPTEDPGGFPGGVGAPAVVAGGGKVVVFGGGGYMSARHYVPIVAQEFFHGRWHARQVVAGKLRGSFPGAHGPVVAVPSELSVDQRGQAAIVYGGVDKFGANFGYFASFDFR